MRVHTVAIKKIAKGGFTFRIGDAEVTLQACLRRPNILVIVDAPAHVKIEELKSAGDSNPAITAP